MDAPSDITVLYDILDDTVRALQARYIALGRAAQASQEQGHWKARMRALRDKQRAIDPSDRDAIEDFTRWCNRELRELKERG
ncbi:hypothetical protein NI17_024020 (plasmid) [Thermobifida halotolerans]|uniref:Uncharacterized protein n=1 Tax=Thermobifida halotolerans TaxID=483545 RepID=A0A399FU30_9ACTN|nr:hypothetical protein [Thermobifida halotolerans]UOE22282.1 hypothetical protein NI17_024020 [Thermobifida halotolerans]